MAMYSIQHEPCLGGADGRAAGVTSAVGLTGGVGSGRDRRWTRTGGVLGLEQVNLVLIFLYIYFFLRRKSLQDKVMQRQTSTGQA
jgi:hypothetical protein